MLAQRAGSRLRLAQPVRSTMKRLFAATVVLCAPIVLSCRNVGPNPAGIWVYNYSDRERECLVRHKARIATKDPEGFIRRCREKLGAKQ